MTKTIWFDVTRLHEWDNLPVGIVRVQVETARHLLSEFSGDTRFCRLNREEKRLIEASRTEVDSYIRRLDLWVEGRGNSLPVGTGQLLRKAAKKAITFLPNRLQVAVIRLIRQFGYIVASRFLVARPRRYLKRIHLLLARIERKVKKGDVYINLDLDVDTDSFSHIYRIKKKTGIRVVGMCYDLIPITLPHLISRDYARKFYYFIRNMARYADEIMCISHNTLNDLEKFLLPVKDRRPVLKVLTLGGDLVPVSGVLGEQVRALCQAPYILYVSTIELRKNHDILYRAYRKLVEMGRKDLPRLFLVGKPGWNIDGFLSDLRQDETVAGLIVTLEHVNDAELSYLYRHALLTVYPSLYEGWGLPVVESLTHGKFCIASSASSIPEAGGEFVEYLDPRDLSAWVERLAYYIGNQRALRDREAIIRSGYRPHTWSGTTRTLVNYAMGYEGE